MTSREYWVQRARDLAETQKAADEALLRKLKADYDRLQGDLDQELAGFYARYAKNERITLAEARRRLRGAEREQFRMSLDEFREKARVGGYDQELNEIYLRSRVSRLQALETQIELRVRDLFQSQRDVLREHLAETYTDTYYRAVYAASQQARVAENFARVDIGALESVLSTPWLGADFSARVWENRDKLVRELETTLAQAIVRGDPLDRMSRALADRMQVSRSRAETLVHTESAHIAAQATMRSYRETGRKRYAFVAGLDLKTCPVCGALDKKVFAVSDAMTGVNYPPIHPRCRCTTVADVPAVSATRAARDPVTDKTVFVDQGLSYTEWHEKYVANVPEAAAAEKAYRNRRSDRIQYAAYRNQLGAKNVPKSLAEFQKVKYTDSEAWERLQSLYRSEGSGLQQQLSYVYHGEKLFIPKGTKFDKVITMAGKGAEKPIRVAERLAEEYGGAAADWKKQAGKITSSKYVFDVHWYERDDGVQHETKLKNRTERKK